jgi:hypothetical protein
MIPGRILFPRWILHLGADDSRQNSNLQCIPRPGGDNSRQIYHSSGGFFVQELVFFLLTASTFYILNFSYVIGNISPFLLASMKIEVMCAILSFFSAYQHVLSAKPQ